MVNDILNYYDLKTNNYRKGLFETYSPNQPWSDEVKKSQHGVSYTQFIATKNIHITDTITLLDMFHGLCYTYLSYFITMNPDWTPVELRRTNFWTTLIHAYATKEINGVTYFADARGISDNCLDFFNDYRFSKNNMSINHIHDLPELTYEDSLIMKKAYDIIYGDEPIILEQHTTIAYVS